MNDMKLIMENFRKKMKEARSSGSDAPADGLKPIEPSVYSIHAGGEDGDTGTTQMKGARIKNRRQISIYPKPGSLFDSSTGQIDPEAAKELMDIIDKDKDLMMSSDDPYVDDWLERTHAALMDAIEGLRAKGQEDLGELDATLDAKFASAVADIRAIIQSRGEETLDLTDPRVDTIPGFDPETF